MDLKAPLYGLEAEEIQDIVKKENLPSYRAKQILHWLYQKNIASFEEAKNLPGKVRQRLASHYSLYSLQFVEKSESRDQEARKFLFRTRDEDIIESVLIVHQNRVTLCVSTQLGCKMGCVFCASGKGGFRRNLTAGEIVEQIAWIQRDMGHAATNIVFMGMGEPLDNFEETMKALRILQAKWGFKLGARRMTVSTVGIPSAILRFVEQNEGRVKLSVSLHSGDERTRTKLVPVNKRYSIHQLREALEKIHRRLKRQITFEYTLIQDVNDSLKDAEKTAKLAKPLQAKVNIIPYNPVQGCEFKTPSDEQVERFCKIIHRYGVRVTVRKTAGRDVNAACGQLRLQRGITQNRAKI